MCKIFFSNHAAQIYINNKLFHSPLENRCTLLYICQLDIALQLVIRPDCNSCHNLQHCCEEICLAGILGHYLESTSQYKANKLDLFHRVAVGLRN